MKIYENLSLEDLDGEIWKDIGGFNGNYQISNYGRIKSFKRYHGKDIRILRQIKYNHGYLYVNLYKNGEFEPKSISHLVYETFGKKLSKDECVHHLDKNVLNNNYNNLEKMTIFEHSRSHNKNKIISEKTKEKISKNHVDNSGKNHPMYGTKRSGEKSGHHKLTEQIIIKIKKSNLTQKKLAELYNVTISTISSIKNGRCWKHIG